MIESFKGGTSFKYDGVMSIELQFDSSEESIQLESPSQRWSNEMLWWLNYLNEIKQRLKHTYDKNVSKRPAILWQRETSP